MPAPDAATPAAALPPLQDARQQQEQHQEFPACLAMPAPDAATPAAALPPLQDARQQQEQHQEFNEEEMLADMAEDEGFLD
jgi:hypothetical protein